MYLITTQLLSNVYRGLLWKLKCFTHDARYIAYRVTYRGSLSRGIVYTLNTRWIHAGSSHDTRRIHAKIGYTMLRDLIPVLYYLVFMIHSRVKLLLTRLKGVYGQIFTTS